MPLKNPLHDSRSIPTKEDLEEYLGPSRYRRFEVVYDELVDLNFTPKLIWSALERSWHHSFFQKHKPIFTIEWGIDYFFACFTLLPAQYSQLIRHEKITRDGKELLQGSAQTRNGIKVEANLEHSKEQEAFFDVLPLLLELPS
ncbi:MAG: hypothetical protein V3W14_02935 [Candidatus Neomarinimicrobiota bacterium]